jgi:hypothetical protein
MKKSKNHEMKKSGVTWRTFDEIDDVQRVVLERAVGGGRYKLIIRVQLVKVRPQVVGYQDRRSHDDMLAVVAEQTAFAVQLLLASVHIDDVPQLEEFVENFAPNLVGLVFVYVWHDFVATPLAKQWAGRRAAFKLVNLQTCLVAAECDEIATARTEFPQIARWLLDVCDCQIREDALVELEMWNFCLIPEVLAIPETVDDVLRLGQLPRANSLATNDSVVVLDHF